MDTKVLLRLIRDDIKLLDGINEAFIGQENLSSEEIEVALIRSKALLMEFEMLSKNLSFENPKVKNEEPGTERKEEKTERKTSLLRNLLPFINSNDEITAKDTSSESVPGEEIKPADENLAISVENILPEENNLSELEQPVSSEPENISSIEDSIILQVSIDTVDQMSNSEGESITEVKIDSEILSEKDVTEKKTLGEILGEKHQMVNDLLSTERSERTFDGKPLKSIREGIGINDRFSFIKELFNSNVEKYDHAISTLDQLSDIEEAVKFLKQNYKWNKSDASQKFLVLVKRRFSKSNG